MNQISRRQFGLSTAAVLAGYGFSIPASRLEAGEPAIEQQRLVELGLNALSRAADMSYFADGHRGAAMISAHLLCVDNKLDDVASARIVQLFDLNWAGTKLCQSFPRADPVDDAAQQIGKALANGNGVLREVGHDAIFAMHAIKAIRLMPQLATAERVDGVCRLINAIKPWRDVEPAANVNPPPFSDIEAASRFVLKEASDAIDRFIGFGQGFAGHMLTFGQSLIELAEMGDVEWAESCRTAFRKYVTVTRSGPQAGDRRIADHRFSKLRPNEAEYWEKRGEKTLGIGHVFKYPYAYYELAARANSPEIIAEFESKAWHVF
ncbi:MAG: hypothetical protein KDA91_00535 [Planctomycetaceae bacterium]|nr:hypothetical protein [Planctomycetaceae bacterium]